MKKTLLSFISLMLIVVMFVGVKYTIQNYEGYKSNYAINKLNFELLTNYKESDGKTITLYKIANLTIASYISECSSTIFSLSLLQHPSMYSGIKSLTILQFISLPHSF